MGGGGSHENPCLINWVTLCGEACTNPSSSPNGSEINGLYLGPFLPLFLNFFFDSRSSKHQGSCITRFSHNKILIEVFKDFKYLPPGPLKKCHSTSMYLTEISTANLVTNPPMMRVSQRSAAQMILSLEASNLCTNSRVQKIEPSSLHLP